ncbi:MAG: LPS export ABC transporter periplasmic protein LptC [Candidatus Omnitrophota bacterium]
MRTSFNNNMVLLWLAFLAFLVIGAPAFGDTTADPSSSELQQMQDFNIAGYGARGQKTWEVEGASMDMVDNEVAISDITAHLYGDKENMTLTADNGRFDKRSGVMRLENNVRATTDQGATLSTDSLDWSQKEQLITTDDKVNINKNNMTAVATGLEAKPDFKVAKLEKDVLLTIDLENKDSESILNTGAKSKINVTCDGPMELDYEKNFAIFNINVKVQGDPTQGTMYADKMTVYFGTDTKQIDKMEAEGHVKIVRDENTSLSERAVFTAADKRMVLSGKPQLVIYTEEGFDVSP